MKNNKDTIIVKDYQSKKDVTWQQYKDYGLSSSGDDVNEEFLINRMLKIFYNISMSDARLLDANQINTLLTKLLMVLNQPISKFQDLIFIDGVEYGFFEFHKMSFGELIDLDRYREEADWIKIAAICYRKVISKSNQGYVIESYKGDDTDFKIFKDIPLYYIEGLQSLFIQSWNRLNQIILTSTHNQ